MALKFGGDPKDYKSMNEYDQQKGKPGNEKEVRDYGYGGVVTTDLTGTHTRIFTGSMNSSGNAPYFDVKGRGPF